MSSLGRSSGGARRSIPTASDGPWRFSESYFVARCAGGDVFRAGWQALERELVDDIRWWSLAELIACDEPVFPEGLADLMSMVLAKDFVRWRWGLEETCEGCRLQMGTKQVQVESDLPGGVGDGSAAEIMG